MPSCDNGRPLTGAAPQARHGVPLQQHNLQGAALHPTCRLDGVDVDRSLPPDAVQALRDATTLTAPLRGHRSRPPRRL